MPKNIDSFARADISNCWAANDLEQLVKPPEMEIFFLILNSDFFQVNPQMKKKLMVLEEDVFGLGCDFTVGLK